ncbi:hypothetical protein BGZ51_003526 [Haplosporangium sp. Z 767]|nr:hypothetical protein BGZ51_003526 [Haplosporangium sp. Z 767]KAF9191372.1 hypothetical protein BGZ50_009427 [Haplosporangium sp. Z 11]
MPSDTPAQDAAGAPAPKVDFTSALAKVKAIAAKLGSSASTAAPPAAAPSAPAPMKRPYEEDSYGQGHDSRGDDGAYGKRMAYDSGRDSAPMHRPGLGAQVSHYAPPMRNEHSIQEEMGVPGNLVGLIIGRGGENLKRIERETGCRVQFSQDGNPGDRERFVNIIGQPAGIADAKRQIQEIITSSQTGDRQGGGGYGSGGGGGGYGGGGSYGMGGGGGGYGRGGTTSTMQIPSTKVGLVIGRGGETIRDLQDRSGARIAVTPSPQDHNSPSRTVSITGDEGAIERAKSYIEEIVNDMAPRGGYGGGGGGGYQSTPPVTMTVPQESIGLVIGRGGETVKQLQIQSRAKIQVQQVDPSMPPPAERTINLFGPPEAVEYAKQLIMEKVAGARDNDRYGGQRDQGGYGSSGSYGGYQQQQYQQPAQSSTASTYGQQYGGYTAPASTAATAGYTPEQQAAYAQYYGYQYGAGYQYGGATPATSGAASTSAAPGTDATTAAAPADSSAYGAYDYSRYASGQYGTAAATAAAIAGAAASSEATSSTPAATITPATSDATTAAAATSATPDYSAYYAQQGYSQEAYQQYYSQYYGYQQPGASTETAAASTDVAATSSAAASIEPSATDVPAPAASTEASTASGAEESK